MIFVGRHVYTGDLQSTSWGGGKKSAIGDPINRSREGWEKLQKGGLQQFHARLQGVKIENRSAFDVIRDTDGPNTLHYLDPPYAEGSRKGGGFKHELTNTEQDDLVKLAMQVRGHVILSGYDTPLYKPLENAGWGKLKTQARLNAAGTTEATKHMTAADKKREEFIWVSPSAKEFVYAIAPVCGFEWDILI